MATRHKFPATHGKWGTHRAEYRCWQDMKQRCFNERNASFKNYGGRGITVCDRWRNDFQAFLDDMGLKPDGTSLDRINNDGDYEPSNCRWATKTQQSRNTRRTSAKDVGVFLCKQTASWLAYIAVEHRSIRIGAYKTKDEAICARKKAEQDYWAGAVKPPPKGALPRNNTSGFVGVYQSKRYKTWIAYYGGVKARVHIGSFKTAEQAVAARSKWLAAHGIGGQDDTR